MIDSNNNEKYFFEINKNKDNFFYFNLKDKNGKIHFKSGSYAQKTDCKKGIKSVIMNSKKRDRFYFKYFLNGLFVAYLNDANNKVIAIYADLVTNDEELENFTENLKSLSLKTPVIDKTK